MTNGLHYRCDYRQFSRLLGFDHHDREALSLYDHYPNGVGRADFIEAGMYVNPEQANGKTDGLKPHFYVLNNLLRATIDSKIGDSTSIQNHAPRILVCFGLDKRFSVTDLLWHHIDEVSLTSTQSFPYAPYLMYIIEQVTGFDFPCDMKHPDWNVRRLQAQSNKGKGKATEASDSGAGQVDEDALAEVEEDDVPPVDPSAGASVGRGRGHGRGRGRGPMDATRHALQRFMSYFCYCQAKQDKRMRRLEEKVGLPPASPLRSFVDPYVEYDNLSGQQFDDEEQHDTEDFQEFEQQQGF
jgi:hypothetical protein